MSKKRLSAMDWATIVTLYQRGDKNVTELAEEYEVSRQAIHQGLKARNVVRNSRLSEVTREAADAAAEERERRVQQANALRDNHAKWADILAKLTFKKIVEAEQSGSIPAMHKTIIVIGNALKNLERARKEQWQVLQIEDLLDEDAELPELNVGEYSNDEIEAIQRANEEAFNATIEDDDDYADYETDEDEESEDDEG